MPLFDYRCTGCGKTTELMVLAGDAQVAPVCPACGSSGMTRLLSRFAAHSHKGLSAGFDGMDQAACGAGECETPDMCGTGGCGFGGMDD